MASSKHFIAPLDWIKAGLNEPEGDVNTLERKPGIHSQFVSFVEENDWNLLLRAFFLLVAELAPRRVRDHAWFLEWRRPFLFPLVSGFGSLTGPDPLPERFRPSVILVALMRMVINVCHIGVYVFVIEGFEVPILEEGALEAEWSI